MQCWGLRPQWRAWLYRTSQEVGHYSDGQMDHLKGFISSMPSFYCLACFARWSRMARGGMSQAVWLEPFAFEVLQWRQRNTLRLSTFPFFGENTKILSLWKGGLMALEKGLCSTNEGLQILVVHGGNGLVTMGWGCPSNKWYEGRTDPTIKLRFKNPIVYVP